VGSFTLGNTRLAIQDPGPAGNQPFASPDGRYRCVFNGEIYNYRSLVEDYELPVRTACDGEVIPHLWAKLGQASLAQLRGMFAIALVDCLEDRLYLARDPFGIKPLYWRILTDGPMIFASEIRPLARVAAGVRISAEAIARYLHLGAMAADQSPFAEIKALPPNSVGSFTLDGQVTIRPILPEGPLGTTYPPTDLGSALAESVDLHFNADVPTALLLSAGVDSAAIAAIGHRIGRRLHCITVATQDAVDESDGAANTARHYRHHFQRIPAALESSDVANFFAAMQRPSIDGLNTYLVCKAVHSAGFKVALSGLGGDEVVGGYSHFRMLRYLSAMRIIARMPDPVIKVSAGAIARLGVAGEAKAKRLFSRGGPRTGSGLSLLQREVLPAGLVSTLSGIEAGGDADSAIASEDQGSFRAMAAAEVAIYLQATLLPDADTFSMASSVELRVPFVDTRVFAASLAHVRGTARIPGKAAIGSLLNDSFIKGLAERRKRGFSVPMRQWMMTGPLRPVLRAAEEPDAPVWSVVDRKAAQSTGLLPLIPRDRWAQVWAIAALNTWLSTIDY
jgi:asparagine synthase (glutamine-hydrolysing)